MPLALPGWVMPPWWGPSKGRYAADGAVVELVDPSSVEVVASSPSSEQPTARAAVPTAAPARKWRRLTWPGTGQPSLGVPCVTRSAFQLEHSRDQRQVLGELAERGL